MKYGLITILSCLTLLLTAQELPKDFLSPSFHAGRREALRKLMPPNSVAVFFSNPVRNRANDVDYVYHQDPDFYYLTGYREPNSVLVIFSENQKNAQGESYKEIFFAQARNKFSEMWSGRRLGPEGVKNELKLDFVESHEKFESFPIRFDKFDKVFFFDFHNDVRDDERSSSDLFDLIQSFKKNASIPLNFKASVQKIHQIIANADLSIKNRKKQIYNQTRFNPRLLDDPIVQEFMEVNDRERAMKISNSIEPSNLDASSLDGYMAQLREVKSKEELRLLIKAVEVSCVGQIEVMKALKPGMSETEIQGIHEFVFKKYGSEFEGYPSIVGAGQNGCILHYIDNNKPRVGNELVLMDLGAEYHGYTADITRTVPADGTFSKEQKAIYNIVKDAQQAGFEMCMPGNEFRDPHKAAQKVIDERLAELGIIKPGQPHFYFPHGTSHYLGLDVHDRGTYGNLKPGTVITVEPGIYIPEGSDCDEKWWGIAVRIEDDVLITENGWTNLSGMAPRSVEEIEKLMAQKSALDDFVLPNLDKPE